MSSPDYFHLPPDPATVPPWPTAIRYGLIGGMVFILYSLIGNLTGIGRPTAGLLPLLLFGLTYFVIYIVLLLVAIKNHRDEDLGGYIDLKRSIILGATVAVIAGVISSLFGFLYMTVIEPDIADTMVAEMEVMFENMGLPEEQYLEELEKMEERLDPVGSLIQGLTWSPIIGGVVSLILGAILKKEPPVLE